MHGDLAGRCPDLPASMLNGSAAGTGNPRLVRMEERFIAAWSWFAVMPELEGLRL